MHPTTSILAAALLLLHVAVISCDDDDDHDIIIVDDVSVDITGDAGTNFDAFFEDDVHSQSVTGDVPFAADFPDQQGFFQAIVDKTSGGSEQVCVKISTSDRSEESCTPAPFGRVSVTLVF